MLILSVQSELWMVYPGSGHTVNYAVMFSLVLFLIVVKWVYRSSLDYTAGVRKAILLGELSNRNQASLWGAMLLVLLCLVAWQLLGMVEYLQVSPVSVFRVFSLLVSEAHIWNDVRVSLLEIFGGLVIGGGVALIISMGLSRSVIFRNLMLPLLPLTYVVPIVLLPAWSFQLGLIFSKWTTACVAFLSFFPFVQAFWGLRDQPLLLRILLAVDDALPYAFIAIVYGEAMYATAGLGFAVVVEAAASQSDKTLAVFLLTLGLLAGLSSALR
jgi:ABC-type nitrate/sulfonate/bicarbonate transport system permease component